MSAIRGWVPGAIYKEHIVTDKRVLDGKYGPAYWVAWEGADITRRSTRRTNLGKEQWQTIDIGDRVTIAYYRGNPEPYIPDGIFVSPENFAFDLILFTGEIWIIAHATGGQPLSLLVYYDGVLHALSSFTLIESTFRSLQAQYHGRWNAIWLYDRNKKEVLS